MNTLLDFVLGTAMWGWNVPKNIAFALLDFFYTNGYREIDAATNYPINKNIADFRLSERILIEWIQAHGISDLKIIQKIGSFNNLKTPEINLHKSFLLLAMDSYQWIYGKNLDCLMVHWDNRNEKDLIEPTFEAFNCFKENNLKIGLSGIKNIQVYAAINSDYQFEFTIELKHNPIQSDLNNYRPILNESHRLLAYGINAGGLKLSVEQKSTSGTFEIRGGSDELLDKLLKKINKLPSGLTMNQLGLIYAAQTKEINGVILGCSTVEQLRDSISFGKTAHLHQTISFQ